MGVPHFSTWLTNRYPLVKSSYNQNTLPLIDWLFIDLNDIVYKCALDDSSAFKDVLKGKKFEDIFIQIFNYINEITQLAQPQKMLFLALDGVAPRAKMNQQRARRFKSAKQYQELEIALRNLGILEKEEHFKNNSISPGTEFMHELNKQIKFLIQRKMKEDERWRKMSVVFSGVDVPGESEHKILEYIRRKSQQNGFNPNTTMCFYGSDADFIVLTLTIHLPFLCVLQEQSNPRPRLTPATKRQQQQNSYEFLWVNVLREYFEAEFGQLKEKMGDRYNVDRVIDDFVFLCFFIANDFLPRVFCMDSKTGNLDKVIEIFKETMSEIDGYISNKGAIVWPRAAVLLQKIAQLELKFIEDKLEEQQMQQKAATNYNKVLEEVDTITIQSNREVLLEVKELKEEYEELERLEREEELSMSSDSEEENPAIMRIKKVGSISTPRKMFPRKVPGKTSVDCEADIYAEDLDFKGLNDSNSYDSTSKSYTGDNNNVFNEDEIYRDKKSDRGEEEDKELIKKLERDMKKGYIDEYLGEVYANSQDAEATKLEEAENYLLTYTNEENVLRQLSARALENDIKFMTSLVKSYKQNRNEAQKFFYEEKFGINVLQDTSELTRILVSYIQGLQYVSSYYYTNSPSWDWYYPYYCSPLLSDLANMMVHLNSPQIVQGLIRFNQGRPYDPLKQLLLILPPTSMHLLPECLQAIVSNPESSLNKYFPTEFQIDPFGAVSESDYLAKIPFIDDNVLEAEYQKALKDNKFTKGELTRNVLGSNFVYEWNPKLYEYEVESTLPLYFDKFRARIKVSQFVMEDMAFDPTKILERPPQGTYKYHRSFPCMNFIQEKKFEMKEHQKKGGATFLRCCIRLGQRLNLIEYKQYRKLLDQPFYCMYPFLLGCFVMGIVTPDQLITNIPYQELPFRYKKAVHRDYYMSLNTNVHDFYFSQMGVLFKESMMYFALIYLESEVRKDSLGNIYSLKPRMAAIPLNLLIDTNVMPKYRGKIDYSPKDLTKEFLMHSEVVINIGPPAGSLARVVGYKSETSDFDNVEVKIVKTPPKLGAVTAAIAAKYDDHRNYRSIYHVAKKLGVDVQVVLHVLDRLIIKTEASLNTKSLYPERFDIGLNFIHRKNHTIVAELVICNELRKQRKSRYTTFTHFQLAPEAINLLKNYYTNHKAVFEAIANKIRLGDPSPLTAKCIFPNAEDPNLEAFKIYIWILKQENSNLSLTNKASKVIPREGIRELEKVLGGSKNYLGEQAKHILNKVFPYNPNFLIPKSADNWVPPFYSKQPPWHKLGDRVVNLRINGCNFAPFGAVGTIVGILGNKPENGLWKVKIEVMFDYPFIGGTNLGGRCSWGRGAVVNFDDIFNLKRWEKCIQARDPKRSFFNQSWDGVFPNSYVPSFQTASEISDTEEESTRVNQPNIPISTILPEDLLLKHFSDKKKAEEKREITRKKNKSQTQKRPEKRESSPTKHSSIVPKTLGLLGVKKTENPNEENIIKETTEKIVQITKIKPFTEDAIREPSPDTKNKLDFNTLISNTLPPTLNTETLQNTSFSISSRFSIGNASIPELPSHIRSPVFHTWAQEDESILDMKEDLYKINTMQSKTPNILKSDRIETLRKIGDRRNTIEPLVDFAFKPRKVAEKENIQNTMYNLRREVENNDTEDGGAEQIFVEVSQGGRLVKEETITLEIVENKEIK